MTNFEPCAAEVMRRFANAMNGETIEMAGGVAGYLGPDFPMNAVKGMEGPAGQVELQRVIEFYGDRGLDAVLELAPWVESASLDQLNRFGFAKVAEEDVMVRPSAAQEIEVDTIEGNEEWARVLSLAFFGEVNALGLALGGCMKRFEGATCVGIQQQGALVAAAQLCVFDDVGLPCGDGTLESHRGQGLQQRLIRSRVGLAHQRNLPWVHSEVQPGSISQRNYQRCGFLCAYPRVHFVRPRY